MKLPSHQLQPVNTLLVGFTENSIQVDEFSLCNWLSIFYSNQSQALSFSFMPTSSMALASEQGNLFMTFSVSLRNP